jgi:thymidine phosphorylase
VLAVLRNRPDAPADLAERALRLAGELLEFGGAAASGQGLQRAHHVLASGLAWAKFQEICAAQGGMRDPAVAPYRHAVAAAQSGRVTAIDNRRLARFAKLAGAPLAPSAGVDLHVHIGTRVDAGQPLFTLHAESPGELAYALGYAVQQSDTVQVTADA